MALTAECFEAAAELVCRGGGNPADLLDLDPVGLRRPAWQASAACRTVGLAVFFSADVDGARRVCAGCPVSDACLAYALAAGATHGVFGGLSAPERAALTRRRDPRAVPAAGARRRRRRPGEPASPCSGCGAWPAKARGLCPTCYHREWRHRRG